MRSWYLSRIALERGFHMHDDQQSGVYDRRSSTVMFIARVMSGLLALGAFVYGLSTNGTRHSHDVSYGRGGTSYLRDSSASFQAAGHENDRDEQGYQLGGHLLNGTRLIASDGTEMVFQVSRGGTKGTVLLLHGCSHSATDFFPTGQYCSSCIGLPEEVKMTTTALKRRYNVIAVSSTERSKKCWKTHLNDRQGADYQRIATAFREAELRGAYSAELPTFAIGISAGGLFATSLPLQFKVAGVNSIISSSVLLSRAPDRWNWEGRLPPHVFTHMGERDWATAGRVRQVCSILKNLGTPSLVFSARPRPVTASYLLQAVPRWDPDIADELVRALVLGNHLDSEYYLTSNPRSSSWRASVAHLKEILRDNLVDDRSALSEQLNKAWGDHEITADYFEQTLDFLEGKLYEKERFRGDAQVP